MDLISVIVPVYNVEKYLDRCIQSINNQTYKDLEIILVDDGSTDMSGSICDDYAAKDKRIHVIHKVNVGLSDARNVGVDAAHGNYIAFVDSDDWIDRDTYELLLRISKKYDADIVEHSYRCVYSNRIEEETNCSGETVEGTNMDALQGMLDWRHFKPTVWNKLYKRDVIGNIRFSVGKWHEDEFTIYKIFYQAKKLIYIDVSKYNYDRTREDSITGQGFNYKCFDACEAFRERYEFFRDKGLNDLITHTANAYCWILFDRVDKYLAENENWKYNRVLKKQAKSDLIQLKDVKLNEDNICKLTGLAKGVKVYKLICNGEN